MKLDFIDLPAATKSSLHGTPIAKEFEPGLVSVVLPTFNRSPFLPEAIASVWEQTYRPIELLIVDDGSNDNTAEMVWRTVAARPEDPAFRSVYLRQTNRGASAARNQGLLHSHGEFIQYLDSDDVIVRHKVADHVRVLQADEGLDIVWSDWLVLRTEELQSRLEETNRRYPPLPPGPFPNTREGSWQETDKTIPWEPWPTLTRRRFVAKQPLWNEKTSRWDDWEYALRIMAANPRRAYSPGIVCIQRDHRQGRRQDFDFDPSGIEKGLMAIREAGAARDLCRVKRPDLDQFVAERYWELFIEAVRHRAIDQASEAIRGACRYARRAPFRVKTSLLKAYMCSIGIRATGALLRRCYLPKPVQ